jgi:hypothetical protein
MIDNDFQRHASARSSGAAPASKSSAATTRCSR